MVELLRDLDISAHDRYLIYHMLGRRVSVSHVPEPEGKLHGVVKDVVRDIFTSAIEIAIDGKRMRFKEPRLIVSHMGNIVFLYGDIEDDISDDQLFAEMHSSEHFGSTVNDVIYRNEPQEARLVHFELGEKVLHRCRCWRKAVAA